MHKYEVIIYWSNEEVTSRKLVSQCTILINC